MEEVRNVTYLCDNCNREYEPSEVDNILTLTVNRADAHVDIFLLNRHVNFIPDDGYLHFCNEICIAEYIKKLLHPM